LINIKKQKHRLIFGMLALISALAVFQNCSQFKVGNGISKSGNPFGDGVFIMGDQILQKSQMLKNVAVAGTDGFGIHNSQPWPFGTVPVDFENGFSDSEKSLVLKSCNVWGAYANVRCVAQSSESNYLIVTKSTDDGNCYAPVGRPKDGQLARLYLGDTKCFLSESLVHYFGHVFGLIHEHQRPDRTTFIDVLYPNILIVQQYQFVRLGDGRTLGAYDFLSIMHYDGKAFTANGQNTLVAKVPYVWNGNPNSQISKGDQDAIASIYGRSGVPTLVGTITSGEACSIAVGQSTCTNTVAWISNSPRAGVRAVNGSNVRTCDVSPCDLSYVAGTWVLTLLADINNVNSTVLDRKTITVIQTVAPPIEVVSIGISDGCTIPLGQPTCPITISWTINNAPNAGVRIRTLGSATSTQICVGQNPCTHNLAVGSYLVEIKADGANTNSTTLRDAVSTAVNAIGGGGTGAGSVTISCTPSSPVTAGSSVTCTAVTTNILSGYWTSNGTPVSGCEGQISCPFPNVVAGNYAIRVVAIGTDSQPAPCNTINYVVNPVAAGATISISCSPLTVTAGQSVTCTSVSSGIVSGFWESNGSQYSPCDNLATCTASATVPGILYAQAKGFDSSGALISSGVVPITVNAATGGGATALTLNCSPNPAVNPQTVNCVVTPTPAGANMGTLSWTTDSAPNGCTGSTCAQVAPLVSARTPYTVGVVSTLGIGGTRIVNVDPPSGSALTGLSLNCSPDPAVNPATVTCTATPIPAGASVGTLSWTTNGAPNSCTGNPCSQVAPVVGTPTVYTVGVSSSSGPSTTDTVTVNPPAASLTAITVTCSTPVTSGASVTCNVTPTPAGESMGTLTWTVDGAPTACSGSTCTQPAPTVAAPQNFTVSVSSSFGPSNTDVVTVNPVATSGTSTTGTATSGTTTPAPTLSCSCSPSSGPSGTTFSCTASFNNWTPTSGSWTANGQGACGFVNPCAAQVLATGNYNVIVNGSDGSTSLSAGCGFTVF
jgi:hypothetical protein